MSVVPTGMIRVSGVDGGQETQLDESKSQTKRLS